MARASAVSKGHNWRLKVFTRALTQMEGIHIPQLEPVLFDLIIIYMNFHRLNCPCSPVFNSYLPVHLNKYNFIFVTNTNLHSNKYYIINEQWVQLLKGHGRMRIVECFSLWSECELGVVGTPEATPATLLRIVHFLGWLTWVDSSKASSWAKSRSEVLLDWDSEGLPSSGTSILLGGSLLNERE